MSPLSPVEQAEFKVLELEEKMKAAATPQDRKRVRKLLWYYKKRVRIFQHREEVRKARIAAAAKAREALRAQRNGEYVPPKEKARQGRLHERRLAAVAEAGPRILTPREEPVVEQRILVDPLPVRWRLTDGRTTIDLGVARKNITVVVDNVNVVDLNP